VCVCHVDKSLGYAVLCRVWENIGGVKWTFSSNFNRIIYATQNLDATYVFIIIVNKKEFQYVYNG
jgi:hypothetical protein